MARQNKTKASRNTSGPSSRADRRAEVSDKWRRLLGLIPGYDCFATASEGDWFDEEAAQDAVDFFPTCLTLVEGEKAAKPFEPEDWQKAFIGAMFGWKRSDGTRRYREVFIFVPRKNGKSMVCAGLVLLVMFTDHEPGAQIFSAAGEREQAALVFRHAAAMIANEPNMSRLSRVYRTYKSIEYQAEGTIYKALSADAGTKHGLSVHFAVIDELHVQPNRDLVDVLMTGTGARRNPMIVHITTADFDRESICNEKHEYACKVRDGVQQDRAFLPVIYEATLEDDWTSPATWKKANPNLGVSVSEEYLRRECQRAKDEPSYENTFRRLHLNTKTQQDVRWLSLDSWDKSGGADNDDPIVWMKQTAELLEGRRCFGGLDLSTTQDLTAWSLVFPPTSEDPLWYVLPQFWCPGDGASKRERRDRVPYETWARQKFISLTPGNTVDYDAVKARVILDGKRYEIAEIAYDSWNATQIALQLQDAGAKMVEFGQGFKSMSEPAKELERLVISGLIAHGMNPVLRWMASHVSIESDPAGNIKPSKKRSTERIDGIVASVMALGRAMHSDQNGSVYDGRGILSIG